MVNYSPWKEKYKATLTVIARLNGVNCFALNDQVWFKIGFTCSDTRYDKGEMDVI